MSRRHESMRVSHSAIAASLAAAFVIIGHYATAEANFWGQTFYSGWYGECVDAHASNDPRESDICSKEESSEDYFDGSYEDECNEETCDAGERMEIAFDSGAMSRLATEEEHHWHDVMLLQWCQYGWSVHKEHFFDAWMRDQCFPPP